MRKAILLISLVSLIAVIAGCGSSSSTANVDTSNVTVSVGGDGRSASITVEDNSFLASVNKLFRELIGSNEASAAIPTEVIRILFTISAPDITTITRLVDVAGRSSITETFNLPNGNNRTILVQALDSQGRVLYEGSHVMNLSGVPVTVDIDMTVLNDFTPPTFSGLSTATAVSTTEIGLSWNPASDNLTPPSQIYYFIYISNSAGGENFSSPSITTNPGVTSYNVTGLNPGTTFYFVVRAVDAHGNTDSNLVERSATTLTPPDVTPPTFAGLTSAVASATVNGRIDLSWSPATDDRTSTSSIVYLIYMATLSGQENYITPNFTSPAGATTYSVTGLSAGNYYFVVRARDEAGNIDANTVERSAAVPDITPPTFAGLTSAVASTTVTGQVDLSWSPASDNITAVNAIIYLVYLSTSPGGENYSSPDYTTSPGATSFPVTGLTSGQHYFVVRARDQAGNIDTNTVERTASVDAIPPTVSSVNLVNVGPDLTLAEITITFSEPMDNASTSDPSAYSIVCSGDCSALDITAITPAPDGRSVVLTLSYAYQCYMTFDLIVTTTVRDLSGNHMTNDYPWTYYTGC